MVKQITFGQSFELHSPLGQNCSHDVPTAINGRSTSLPILKSLHQVRVSAARAIPSFLQGLAPQVVDFAADIESQNFQAIDPSINLADFKSRMITFIEDCQLGHKDFTDSAFRQSLGKDLATKYDDAQKVYREKFKYQARTALFKDFLPTRGTHLDFGGGDLKMAQLLQAETGIVVHACDELEPTKKTNSVPFYKVENHASLPDCVDKQFDSVSAVYVLHHVDPDQLGNVLKEIHRVSNDSVIILEESFGMSNQEVEKLCDKSKQYAQMSTEEQLQLLKLRDYFRNIVVNGIAEMNMPFEFKRIKDWHMIFEKYGFEVRDTKIIGFGSDKGISHSNFNVVFNLKKIDDFKS
jgi:ubiquinone/menaquinone biosynthesis C-methylase UbiE